MNTCPYCTETAPEREACYQPHGDLVCTRAPGHNGPHVACGDEHQIETWGGSGTLTDRARARAEELWPLDALPVRALSAPERMNRRIGFELGARWAACLDPSSDERDAMARAMAEHECKGKPWEQLHENVRDIYLRLADVSAAALAEARRSG